MALSSSSFDAWYGKIQTSALDSVRKSVGIPTDVSFHRSVDSVLATQLDTLSTRVLSLTNRVLGLSQLSAGSTSNSSGRKGKDKETQPLHGQDDVVDSFQSLVVDVVDGLFERTDTCLDTYLGRNVAPAIAINPPLQTSRKHAAHLAKPQRAFKSPTDNLTDAPWYPNLPHKYNAQVPFGFVSEDEPEEPWKRHPYQYEISHLNYPPSMFHSTPAIPPSSLSADSPHTFVTTTTELHSMLDDLRRADAIAIDLEHHSHRSYRGFVCLMQISTRDKDWVIDTLVPEVREELGILNEVFTDPKVVKVLHGSESDIIWLQRDFSLYIVNLFDTFHASKVLDFPRHGLANLLEMYCDFSADKQYQLADWRIRPLPDAMINYARSDTHFLLFIYDNLRNALLDRGLSRSRSQSQARSRSSSPPSKKKSKSPSPPVKMGEGDSPPHALLHEVLARSSMTALKVYERETYDVESGLGPGGWEGLARKWNKATLLSGDNEQGRVYRAVHAWRDKVAREEDESTRYTLPNHHIFQFAERPPIDMAGLLAMFPTSRVPPVVRTRARELLDTILKAVRGAPSTSVNADSMVVVREVAESVAQTEAHTEDEPNPPSELPSLNSDSSMRIWGTQKSTASRTTVSTLLGTSKKSIDDLKPPVSAYVSMHSSFLNIDRASGSKKIPANNSYAEERAANFTEVLQRIHASLTIMPKAPPATNIEANTDVAGEVSTMDVDASTTLQLGAEIAFVPRSERKTLATTEVEDTIILVGQRAKKRKRKETKSTISDLNGGGDPPSSASSSAKKIKKTRSIEAPFDFSSVPNILDDEPIKEDARPKRQRKQGGKGEVFSYGNFPRPPKAHSELRSGNQSHTFKK
ncbi:hypothetical protein PLEOSDRAFT_51863 [Pleurotus ostreatus PC15]|uniref:HRDC domain-containing protein n=1 Tax=Pleurotus ostreatus (strain PC15) TaxID=1137138 RepID=A0A067NCE9_PLEO1|nr:hypothetical protein PLEOSDRAFT_51863 [Pleurotus ostreatus PC15]